MFSTVTIRKTIFTLPSLALAACCAAWLAPAVAQSNEAVVDIGTPALSQPLPENIIRSTGKWGGKFDLPDEVVERTALTTVPLQFKLAQPAWLGVLNTAGEIAAYVAASGVSAQNFGSSGKAYQSSRVNSSIPPAN